MKPKQIKFYNIPSLEMNWESQIKFRDFVAQVFMDHSGSERPSSRPIF